ncbi:hypothetical protein TITUS_046 [Escherichia phage vB_Eco_Titus]|nr:hypothetical protein TITUS_046 [Escherichia phage vB_Eco_Titus]
MCRDTEAYLGGDCMRKTTLMVTYYVVKVTFLVYLLVTHAGA